jgi:hypothetical protein
MSTTKIYLDLPADAQALLEDNHISLEDELAAQGVDAAVSYEPLPYGGENGARDKELVLVILASAAAVVAVGHVVQQIIYTLDRRPRYVEVENLEEVRDEAGRVITDAAGQPVFKPVKRYQLLEPKVESSKHSVEIEGSPTRVVIKVSSETTPIASSKGSS